MEGTWAKGEIRMGAWTLIDTYKRRSMIKSIRVRDRLIVSRKFFSSATPVIETCGNRGRARISMGGL